MYGVCVCVYGWVDEYVWVSKYYLANHESIKNSQTSKISWNQCCHGVVLLFITKSESS